jgi:hypothetical protein
VYEGKEPRSVYLEKDIEEGAERLTKALNRITNGSAKVKIYKSVPSKGIDEKTLPFLVLPYEKKYTSEDKQQYWEGRGLGSHMIEEIRSLKADIAGLKAELDEPMTDEEIAQEAQPSSIIAGLVGNPAIQNVIAAFLTNLSANVITNRVAPVRPMAMAGVSPDVDAIINSLLTKGVTVDDFNKLDQMPPERLSFLLSMLRNS